jgi:prepilin-type processing-associated H-X9-DG protein
VYLLPFVEQDALYKQIEAANNAAANANNRIQNAFKAKVLPVVLPNKRCPSDESLPDAPVSNYAVNAGPECAPGQCGAGNSPYRQYCDGASFNPNAGFTPSTNYADTKDPAQTRGLFTRQGTKITFAMVTDGLSNTFLLGEVLCGQNGDIYYSLGKNGSNGGINAGWAQTDGGLALNTTIVPINTFLPYLDPGGNGCVNPTINCDNWNLSFGFRSRHPGGVNFAFADGSVQFISQTIDHRTYQLLGCRNDGQPVTVP